jgi:hypothetical protein
VCSYCETKAAKAEQKATDQAAAAAYAAREWAKTAEAKAAAEAKAVISFAG